MATNSFQGDQRENAGTVERVVLSLRRSFLLSLAVFGVALIGLGYAFELLWLLGHPVENGVISGMLGIWGTSFLLIGGSWYAILRYVRNY